MPHLRPRNNNILPREVHDGILWKEEKAIRKAQLASLLENQKTRRKYSDSLGGSSSSMHLKEEIKAHPPFSTKKHINQFVKKNKDSLCKVAKNVCNASEAIAIKHTSKGVLNLTRVFNSLPQRTIIRYSLSPEYLAKNHKPLPTQSECWPNGNQDLYHIESAKDTNGFITDEDNLTPTKGKSYLAQRKFAQNDVSSLRNNYRHHDSFLANPLLHTSPNLAVGPGRPGVIKNVRTIRNCQMGQTHTTIIVSPSRPIQRREGSPHTTSVIKRAFTSKLNKPRIEDDNSLRDQKIQPDIDKAAVKSTVTPKPLNKRKRAGQVTRDVQSDLMLTPMASTTTARTRLKNTRSHSQANGNPNVVPRLANDASDSPLDTTDFLSWLYMRHLPEMPSHLKEIDNQIKLFLSQKVESDP